MNAQATITVGRAPAARLADSDEALLAGAVMPVRRRGLDCPHCGHHGMVSSSTNLTPTHRIIYYQCSFAPCSHSWRASLSYEYGLSPSGIPNPQVDLPLRLPSREDILAMRQRAGEPPPDPNQLQLFEG